MIKKIHTVETVTNLGDCKLPSKDQNVSDQFQIDNQKCALELILIIGYQDKKLCDTHLRRNMHILKSPRWWTTHCIKH